MASKKKSSHALVKKRVVTEDKRVIAGSGNVFVDLGFDEAEAKVMAMRAEVMIQIELRLKQRGWTQTEAAKLLRITQPRVSQIKKGAWQEFTLDTLLKLAGRAGLNHQLRMVA